MGRVNQISVPTGGGALRGTGETFEADPATGVLTLSVPLDLPEVGGLVPDIGLRYASTSGSGLAGLGWDLAVPRIARRTDRGVPRHTEADTFVLTGSEELVAVPLGEVGLPDLPEGAVLTRYRPRSEGGHARILRVTGGGQDYWEVWTGDGWRQRFGTRRPVDAPGDWADPAAIVRPGGGTHAWLLSRRWDSLAGEIRYEYERDPGGALLPSRVRYGRLDVSDASDASDVSEAEAGYAVTLACRYEPRPDVVTDRRPGFAVATTRRLRRLEIATVGSGDTPVRVLDLSYHPGGGAGLSLLAGVRVTGTDAGGATQTRAPLTFGYTPWEPQRHRFDLLSPDLPAGPVGESVQLLDLFGDGLPSVVTTGPGARYWRALGGGRFATPRTLAGLPTGTGVAGGSAFEDVDGDGRPEAYVPTGSGLAVYSLAEPAAVAAFDPVPLSRRVALPTIDRSTHELDLEGRHIRDLVVPGSPPVVARADGRGGFDHRRPLPGAPAPLTQAGDRRVRLADMTGDGLTDAVLIDDGRVTYWPSLGHGRFDAPVTMTGAPRFGEPGHAYGYDPDRLLVGDLTGDGSADLTYVGDGTVTVWLNRCGQSFAAPLVLRGMPRLHSGTNASLVDLTGTGMRGILWTGVGTHSRWAWLDLTGGTKPYLLTALDNGVGARSEVEWSTSTAHALADRAAGRPWRTTVPFPVHVVTATTRRERFSGTRLRHDYAYHDGCWDPVERELRGFGRVDVTEHVDATDLPRPPARVHPLDPLTPRQGPPENFDAASHGNLLADWSFDDAVSSSWAAVGTPGLDRVASDLPCGAGGHMLRLTGDAGDGIGQHVGAHRGPVVASAWVRVRTGRLSLSLAGADVQVGPTDGWVLLELPAEVAGAGRVALVATQGPLDADIDHVWLRAAPEHAATTGRVVTTSWFHLGPVPRPRGQWTRYDGSRDFWAGDPALWPAVDGWDQVESALGRTELRSAARALRGRPVRREVWALDDDPARSARPQSVEETTYALVPLTPGCVSVRTVATRSTTWERGDDPKTGLTAYGGFDEYDRPGVAVALGVPRGRDPRAGGEPVLGTVTTTTWCTRDDETLLRTDLSARQLRRAIVDDGARGVPDLVREVLAGQRHGEVLGATWQRYDGAAFEGLPTGEIGEHGLLTAADSLALTPQRMTALRASTPDAPQGLAWPGWLAPPGEVAGPSAVDGLPAQVRASLPPAGGHVWVDDDEIRGWAVPTTRVRLDTQADGPARGLPLETRDAWGGPTVLEWDVHGIVPVAVTDPAGLTTRATVDLRLLVHDTITDPNGAVTAITRTPLGLVAGIARLGVPEQGEGDDPDRPGTSYEYDLDPAEGAPVRVTTRTRVRFSREEPHEPGTDELTAHPERFVTATAYQDGLGRTLQTRTTADATVAEDLGLDGSPGTPTAPVRLVTDLDRVVVAVESLLDGRGAVALALEPRFGVGHDYEPLTELVVQDRLAGGVTRTVRDLFGRVVLIERPNGAQERTRITSPWTTTAVDAVACTGWAMPTRHLDQAHRWGVTRTVEVDALGRVVRAGVDVDGRTLTTTTEFDLDGRVLAVSDRTGGTAIRHRVDLLGRGWVDWTPSGGTTRAAYDALGEVVESHDARGTVMVTVRDGAHRPVSTWAADRVDEPLRPRTRTRYGDEAGFDVPHGRSRVVEVHDDAGLAQTLVYRFDGVPMRLRQRAVSVSTVVDAAERGADSLGSWSEEALGDAREDVLTRDALGRVLTSRGTLTGGRTVATRQDWDRTGLLLRVTADGADQLRGQTRDARGLTTVAMLGDGTLQRWLRDPATGRLRRRHVVPAVSTETGWAARGPAVQDETQRWDAGGATTQVELRGPGCGTSARPGRLVRRYGRDALGRLVSATGREIDRPSPVPWLDGPRPVDLTAAREYREAYTYDDNDVLTALAHHPVDAPGTGYRRELDVDPVTRRLVRLRSGSFEAAYRHDAAGNVVAEGASRVFEWDAAGRLVGARTTDGAGNDSMRASYRHAADGARLVRVVRAPGRALEVTLQLGDVERLVRVAADGTREVYDEQHLAADGLAVATLRLGAIFPQAHLPDQPVLRTLRGEGGGTLVLSGSGELLAWEDFTPYGETSFGGHERRRDRYGGRPRDVETGLQQFGARHYAPWLGRWLSVDPAGVVDGPNLYGYARCDPVTFADPTGLAAQDDDGFLGSLKREGGRLWDATKREAKAVGRGVVDAATSWQGAKDYVAGAADGFVDLAQLTTQLSPASRLSAALTGGESDRRVDAAVTWAKGKITSLTGAQASSDARTAGQWLGVPIPGGAIVGGVKAGSKALAGVTRMRGARAAAASATGLSALEPTVLSRAIKAGLSVDAQWHMPGNIRFSQNSVNNARPLIGSIAQHGWLDGPIDAVRMTDGRLTTVDNTRLLAAHTVNRSVLVRVHESGDPIPLDQHFRFLDKKGVPARTWGEAIDLRLRRQASDYRRTYPSGSPWTGWNGQ